MKKPHEKFCWYEACLNEGEGRSAEERYRQIVDWASRARGINPTVFDELSAWLLRSGEWNSDEIAENGKYLMDQIIGKFREQNRLLRIQLEVLKPSGLVNEAGFITLAGE